MINLQVIDGGLEPDQGEIELRQALRKALEQRDAALAVRDKAQATVEAARQHLAVVEGELKQYDGLDDEIAARHATLIGESLESGGGLPDLDTPELNQLIARRMATTNRANAVTRAAKRLQATLDDANAKLRERQAAVDQAALKIVGHAADARARELAEIEQAAATLRRRLLGACVLRPPGSAIPLAAETLKLLRDDSASALVSKNDTSMGALWNGLFTRLSRGDYEARLED